MNKEIKKSESLKNAIDILLSRYDNSPNIPIPSELLVRFKDLDVKSPSSSTVLNAGTLAEPVVLNYGKNVINPSTSHNYFRLPNPVTGNTVEIFNNTGNNIYILPPNSASSIDNLDANTPLFVSGSELNFTVTCVKNPTTSIWVSSTSRSNVRVSLGSLQINSTTGADRYWRGNDLSSSTVGVYSTGGFSNDSNYTLLDPGDVFSLNVPTKFYKIVGFTVKTNIPVGDNFDIGAGFEYYRVTGLNSTASTQVTPLPRFTSFVWDTFARFDPLNNEFVKDYLHPTLGMCYMIDVSPSSAGFNPINTTKLSPNRVVPSTLSEGMGAFAFMFTLDATMPTKLYDFNVDVFVDLYN